MNTPKNNRITRKNALHIERVHYFLGSTPHLPQPSVAFVITHTDLITTQQSLDTLDKEFRQLFPVFTGASNPDSTIIDRIALVTVRLLIKIGMPIFSQAIARKINQDNIYQLQIPTITGNHILTQELVHQIIELANAIIGKTDHTHIAKSIKTLLQNLRAAAPKGMNTLPILKAAQKAGIPWQRIYGNVFQFGHGMHSRWMDSSITDHTPSISTYLAKNKNATNSILRQHGMPVPLQKFVNSEAETLRAAKQIGYPVVIKPANTDRGIGISARINNDKALIRAFNLARKKSKLVLIENHFEGNDYRLHIFEGEVYKARKRTPGGVTGDGTSTIAQLLKILNSDPTRGEPGSGAEKIRIKLDTEALEQLEIQGLSPNSVPNANQFVYLRSIANVSVGGISEPFPIEEVHPDNIQLALRAVTALKLDLAAVDFLTPNIRKSWRHVGAAICEINAQPQFGEDAPEWIFKRIITNQGRIPIVVAVCGHEQDKWIQELSKQISEKGYRLGITSNAGIRINQHAITTAPMTPFQGGNSLIRDTSVQCLLLVADKSLLSSGLPFDRFDALFLADNNPDEKQIQLAKMLSQQCNQVLINSDASVWESITEELGCSEISYEALRKLSREILMLLCQSAS